MIGNPLPTNEQTTWTFNNGPLESDIVTTYNGLYIPTIQLAHDGLYTVNSITESGISNSLNFSLNVLCKLVTQ